MVREARSHTIAAWVLCTLAAGVIALCSGPLIAQDEDARPQDLPKLPDVLKEGTLQPQARIYLPDGKGEPRFVPNIRFGEFLDIVAAQEARNDGMMLPSTSFESVEVDLTVSQQTAALNAKVRVAVSPEPSSLARIDLGFGTCQLTEPIEFTGTGIHQWQVTSRGPGYTWWLKAEPNTKHVASLKGKIAVESENDRRSIELPLPAAPSKIVVRLPLNSQDIRLRGQSGEIIERDVQSDAVIVRVQSSGGVFSLSWQVGNDGKRVVGATEIKSRTRFLVDDPRAVWEAETDINIRQFGDSPSEVLRVSLPPGAVWMPLPLAISQQYSVTIDSSVEDGAENSATRKPDQAASLSGESSTSSKSGVRLRVRLLSRPPAGAAESVVLRWQWTPPKEADSPSGLNISIPVVRVEGVDRHEVITELSLPNRFSLDWKSDVGFELVQQTRSSETPESQLHIFHFVREPEKFDATIRRNAALPEIRQTYLAEIERRRLKLTGWFEVAFDRNERTELGLLPNGWILESAELVSDPLLPLSSGEDLSQRELGEGVTGIGSESLDGEVVAGLPRIRQLWRLVFLRELSATAEGADGKTLDSLKVELPRFMRPRTSGGLAEVGTGAGVFLVSPAKNLLVQWDEARSAGFMADTISNQWLPFLGSGARERVQCYRFQGSKELAPVWESRLEALPRQVSAEQSLSVTVRDNTAQISQLFELLIANEPLEELKIIYPSLIAPTSGVSIFVDGVPCGLEQRTAVEPGSSTEVASADSANAVANGVQPPEGPVEYVVVGAANLIGKVSVELRTFATIPESKDEEFRWVSLPLVRLEDVATNAAPIRAKFDLARTVAVSVATTSDAEKATENDWKAVGADVVELDPALDHIELRLRPLQIIDTAPVRVSKSWLQTTFNGLERVDRFCARFQTTSSRLVIQFPIGSRLPMQLAVDGRPAQPIADPEKGRFEVDLPAEAGNVGSHTLEIWTSSIANLGWVHEVELTVPKIEGCESFDQFFWQLITPPGQHLAFSPVGLTPDWQWINNGLWWERHSTTDQAEFEAWLGTPALSPLPASVNRYVMSSFGPVRSTKTWIVSRILLWIPVGSLSLILAMAVASWRRVRNPVSLIGLAALLLSLALVWPDIAIMAGQTSILALGIVLVYALALAAMDSRIRRRSIFTSRPTSGTFEGSDHGSLVKQAVSPSGRTVAPHTTRTQSPAVTGSGSNG